MVYNQGWIVHLECTVMSHDYSSMSFVKFARLVSKQGDDDAPCKGRDGAHGRGLYGKRYRNSSRKRLYTSLADIDEVVADALSRFETVFSNVVNTGAR